MKRKRTILAAIAFVVIATGFYGGREFFRPNTDILKLKETFRTTVPSLLQEFKVSDTLASKKYLGKIIVVQGNLKGLEKDEKGFQTLVLGDAGDHSSIRCSLAVHHNSEVAGLHPGSIVSVKGEFTGYNADTTGLLGSDVQLNRCAIAN
ncbi:MAG: hypothetical protein ACHQEM_05320 [Chitinophagales bacterium]